MRAAIHSANATCSKVMVFSGDEYDMWLVDFVRHYGYLLRQPNGYLWLVGGGVNRRAAQAIADRYRKLVSSNQNRSI